MSDVAEGTLLIDKILNTGEPFNILDDKYTIIEKDTESIDSFRCLKVDKFNASTIEIMDEGLVPPSFQLYKYRFTENDIDRDDAIRITAIDTDGNKIENNGLVISKTKDNIGYIFRDLTGQFRTNILSARVLCEQKITIRKLS